MIAIRCTDGAPIINDAEHVALWHVGGEGWIVEVTGYWQGLLDRGHIEIIEPALPEEETPATKRQSA